MDTRPYDSATSLGDPITLAKGYRTLKPALFDVKTTRFAHSTSRQLLKQSPVPRNRTVHAKMLQHAPDFHRLGMDHGDMQLRL